MTQPETPIVASDENQNPHDVTEIQPAHEAADETQKAKLSSPRLLAGSIVAGSIVVALSVLYSTSIITGRLNSLNTALKDLPKQTAPVQTAAAPAAGDPSPVGNGVVPAVQAAAAPTGPVDIALNDSMPYEGNPNAKVTVVEFADFQCPFCEKFYSSVYHDLKKQYIDTGKIKFVYLTFALIGQESNDAAAAAKCAQDQGKFWEYYSYIFEHQKAENSGAFKVENLKKFARVLRLDTKEFGICLDSGKYKQEIKDETAAGQKYGVTGTPTLFINGNKTVGAQPFSVFQAAIDAELNK